MLNLNIVVKQQNACFLSEKVQGFSMYVSREDTNQKIASVVEGAETKANDVSTRFSFSEQTRNI